MIVDKIRIIIHLVHLRFYFLAAINIHNRLLASYILHIQVDSCSSKQSSYLEFESI